MWRTYRVNLLLLLHELLVPLGLFESPRSVLLLLLISLKDSQNISRGTS